MTQKTGHFISDILKAKFINTEVVNSNTEEMKTNKSQTNPHDAVHRINRNVHETRCSVW